MLVNLRIERGLDLREKPFNFQIVDAVAGLFSMLLAFCYTISCRRLALEQFSRDLQPIFGAKSATLIGTRANKSQGMFPWIKLTFVR